MSNQKPSPETESISAWTIFWCPSSISTNLCEERPRLGGELADDGFVESGRFHLDLEGPAKEPELVLGRRRRDAGLEGFDPGRDPFRRRDERLEAIGGHAAGLLPLLELEFQVFHVALLVADEDFEHLFAGRVQGRGGGFLIDLDDAVLVIRGRL